MKSNEWVCMDFNGTWISMLDQEFQQIKGKGNKIQAFKSSKSLRLRTVLQRRNLTCLKIVIPNPHSVTYRPDLNPRSFACLHSLLSECKYVEKVCDVTFRECYSWDFCALKDPV